MRIGLVDIDTSHPGAWMPFLREMGHEIVAVWDGGSVHSRTYVRQFAAEHDVPLAPERLEDMPALVDCAIVHSCNWDLHVPRAKPFVAAGKAVLIDKPLAGCVGDIATLSDWAGAGARISGGSSLRTTVEARRLLSGPAEQRGDLRIAFVGCGTDEFNYGIHAYALLWSLMGGGAAEVRFLGERPQWMVEVAWPDGRKGVVATGGRQGFLPAHATMVTTRGVHHLQPLTQPDPLYREFLTAILPYLSGETDEPPIPVADLFGPEMTAVAALESRRRGGETVRLADASLAWPGYDGAAFADEYKDKHGR